jgi:predicted enzyme related to lactoylglutathione lyase
MMQKFPMYAYIPAKDMARARRFYEEKLGLKAGAQLGGGVTYEFAQGTACFLYPTPNAGTSKASQAFWQVREIGRVVAELKGRGVKFEDYGEIPDMTRKESVYTGGGASAAWFKDTEGNIMALIEAEK